MWNDLLFYLKECKIVKLFLLCTDIQ